ncbi:MAG: alginate lyase family protein [Burkholderiaceae bacterium]
MNGLDDVATRPAALAPGKRGDRAAIFLAPWSALDDAGLLAHFRSVREVHVDLIVDEEECTAAKIDAISAGRFEFNGETHALPEPLDWLHNPSSDIEWHILLHKFYYAAGLGRAYLASGEESYAACWTTLIDGWMQSVPPGFIAADVTGRRVQNWIYSLRAFACHGAPHVAPLKPGFFRRLLASLHEQVEFLCVNLTPKRNHRTLELYAIFLAGVAFPEMKRAAHWREFALQETLVNMRADLLADGVHCELSTDYHHLALRNWLNVRTLAARHQVPVPQEMDRLLERALEFSMHVHKPDGSVPSLSDGDSRGFLPLLALGARLYGREDMRWVATRGAQGQAPQRAAMHFAASGYTVLRSTWGSGPGDFGAAQYLVFDSGPLGEGNHGHFDCLNFELAANGQSLIVDPGRFTYSEAPIGDSAENWRVRFRSTAAHNTVCVDGRNQTRYVPKAIKEASRHSHGSVRHKIAGPAPAAALIEFAESPALTLLHGRAQSHEYDAVHERVIVTVDGSYWIVSDALRAPTAHAYIVNFQLGAQAFGQTRLSVGSDVCVASPHLAIGMPRRAGRDVALCDSWVSQRYGCKHAAPALRCSAQGSDIDFDAVLVPWQEKAVRAAVTDLAALGDDGEQSTALRIETELGDRTHVDTWFHARGAASKRWTLCGLDFEGRWLHVRRGADGRVLRAVSHAGASLRQEGQTVPLHLAESRI